MKMIGIKNEDMTQEQSKFKRLIVAKESNFSHIREFSTCIGNLYVVWLLQKNAKNDLLIWNKYYFFFLCKMTTQGADP